MGRILEQLKRFVPLWLGVVLAVGTSPLLLRAGAVVVRVDGLNLDLRADSTPLVDVLKTIGLETGLTVESADSLDRIISCEFKALPIDELLRRFLVNENYVLVYDKDSFGRFYPRRIRILGRGPTVSIVEGVAPHSGDSSPLPEASPGGSTRQELTKRVNQQWFKEQFSENASLAQGLTGTSLAEEGELQAMRIQGLSDQSPFRAIGLKEGDVVTGVNGRAVGSAEEFVTLVESAAQEGTVIRIDCSTDSGSAGTLYVEAR